MKNKVFSRSLSWLLSVAILFGGMFGVVSQSFAVLTASAASVSEKESNDTMATAQTIVIGNTVNATLSESDYQGYFKFILSTSGRLYFDITSYMPSLNFAIYDEYGNQLYSRWEEYWASNTIYSGQYKSVGDSFQWNSISQTVSESLFWDLTSGTYYFRFQFRKLDLETGSYNFTTNFTSANETYKESGWGVNNDMQTASTAYLNKHYIGQIARNDESDYYKLSLSASGRLTANISGNIEYINCRLYNENGDNLLENWEELWASNTIYSGQYKGTGNSFHWNEISKKLDGSFSVDLTKGVYYIFLKRNGGNIYCTGNYDIVFSFKSSNESFVETGWGINNTIDDASAAELNTVYNGQIARNDEYDYYKIVMPKSGTLNTNITGGIPYLNYCLYDDYGNTKEERWEEYWASNTIYSGQYKSVGNSLCLNDVTQSFNETISTELEAGTYYICLKRNSNNVYRTGNYSISFNSDVVISPESIKLNKTSAEIEKGSTLTLTATVYPADVTDKTVTWTTSNSKVATVSQGKVKAVSAGTTTITAKTANGKKASCKVTVQDEILKNSSNVSATSITLGNAFKVTCASTGGTGTKTYAVWYKQSSSSEWTQVQNYNTNTSVSFTPAKAGNYDVSVKVKDSTGSIAKKTFTVTVKDVLLVNNSKISSDSVTLGTAIKVTFASTGGTSTKKYAAWYKLTTDSSWTQAQDYKTYKESSAVSFIPKKTGNYDVSVKVKDGAGTVAKKAFIIKVNEKLANTSKISSATINLGDTIKIKCSATGSSGFYKYAVYYKKASDTSWKTKQDYAPNYDVTFKPASKTQYNLCVKIIDNFGNIAKKNFTITVK